MNESIKELAEQYACITETMTGVETEYIFDFDDLLEFAELIRQDEREACAKLVEEVGRQTAEAIRQRGDSK